MSVVEGGHCSLGYKKKITRRKIRTSKQSNA